MFVAAAAVNDDNAAADADMNDAAMNDAAAVDVAFSAAADVAEADGAVLAIAPSFGMPAPILYTDPSFCFVSSPSQTEVLFKMDNQNLDIKVSSLSQMEI